MEIRESKAREDVRVSFPDGRIFEAPLGTVLEDIIRAAFPKAPFAYVSALVDNEQRNLHWPLKGDCAIKPLTRKDALGRLVYSRSATLLMVMAFRKVFPDLNVWEEYRMPLGGVFCRASKPISRSELEKVEKCMRELAEENLPITLEEVPKEEGDAVLKALREEDKIPVFERACRQTGQGLLVRCGSFRDFFYEFLVPSTGYMDSFALRPFPNGFILVTSRTDIANVESMETKVTRMDRVCRRAVILAHRMNVGTAEDLNRIVRKGHNALMEAVLVCEETVTSQLASIAMQVEQRGDVKLILLAGPSSSGKTTMSKRLSLFLQTRGIMPVTLEMDRYFVEREKTPKDENGNYDFEALQCVDLELFRHDIAALSRGERVVLPSFDFKTGKRGAGPALRLSGGQIIITEGIHALNPALLEGLEGVGTYRIYIVPMTPLNIDSHNHISTRDARLLRRIARDARTRGVSAAETIMRWPSVERGEYRNIYPYQENCDFMLNSMIFYEQCALKPIVEPLLLQIHRDSKAYPKARHLLNLLAVFEPMPLEMVPEISVLREFVGGSSLENYLPGQAESYWSVDAQ